MCMLQLCYWRKHQKCNPGSPEQTFKLTARLGSGTCSWASTVKKTATQQIVHIGEHSCETSVSPMSSSHPASFHLIMTGSRSSSNRVRVQTENKNKGIKRGSSISIDLFEYLIYQFLGQSGYCWSTGKSWRNPSQRSPCSMGDELKIEQARLQATLVALPVEKERDAA